MSNASDKNKAIILRAFEVLSADVKSARKGLDSLDEQLAILRKHIAEKNWHLVRPRKNKQPGDHK